MPENGREPDYFNDLTPIQNKGIRCLLSRASVAQAVRITGVSSSTFYRWLEDENFRAVLRHHTRAVLDSTTRNLVAAAEDCAKLLTQVVNDTSAPLSMRLRAADSVLTHMTRLIALSDMESRLAALERLENGETLNEYAEYQPPIAAARVA